MPRQPEFDPATALDAAMTQFWQYGYFDTSVDDLVKATGVSRYGLYGTFGGKRELFLKALDNYRDVLVTYQLRGLEAEDAGWAEIEAYFDGLLELAKTPRGQAGCFMCNSATELAPHEAEVEAKVGAHLGRLQRAFRKALENAKGRGDLNELDVDMYADVLVGVTQSMFVLSRTPKNLSIIQNLVKGVVKKPS